MTHGPLPISNHNSTLLVISGFFCLKRDPDGSITRYKAHFVAKGFHQRLGIDYTKTYSPVIKPHTIKLVLCIALPNG